jgi:hypothetical protein
VQISKVVLLVASIFSIQVNANIIEHYKSKTFNASSVNVISPSLIEVTAYITDDPDNLSKLYIKTDGLIYDEGDQAFCSETKSSNCERIIKEFESATVQFRLSDPIGYSAFYGTIYINGKSLRHTMIREGWYRFDYTKGRSHYDIFLQKEAECKRKGIWSKVVYSATDSRCQ